MRLIITTILLLTYFFAANAQTKVIKGFVYIVDSVTNHSNGKTLRTLDTVPFIGVSICLLKNPDSSSKKQRCKFSAATDFDGRFEISGNQQELEPYRFIEVSSNYYDFEPTVVQISENVNFIFIRGNERIATVNDSLTPPTIKEMYVKKPAIYLYPTQTTTVSVKHDFKGVIGTTYPAYDSGWMVIAQPNGSLFNLKDNRNYEYLFWDGEIKFPEAHFQFKEGFTVEKRNYASFLLQKLTLVGFNNKEINDFVVYWLPMLNEHPRCFIHFRINDNIDNSSILTVTPKPDSETRLFMEFKPVDDDFNIKEQVLQPYKRAGFHLTEWGGSPIKELQVIQ